MEAYLSIVSGAIKLFNYLAAALQQHHDEMNGVTAQVAADKTQAVKDTEIAQIIRDRNVGLDHDALVAKLRASGAGQ